MAWTTRKGKGRYYVRKYKDHGRVIRQYVGAGPFAEALAMSDVLAREEREERLADAREARRRERELDELLDELARATRTLTQGVLLSAGYHRHNGQWRRRRG